MNIHDAVPKLVRDRLDERIPAEALRICGADERLPLLAAKMGEETREFADSGYADVGELGDMLGVLRALAAESGHDWGAVIEAEERKRAERGGFGRGLVYDESLDPTMEGPAR